MIPDAYVRHRTTRRVRLKISDRRGDTRYFTDLEKKLSRSKTYEEVRVNPLTASVLLVMDEIDVEKIADFGKENSLFQLPLERQKVQKLIDQSVKPFRELNRTVEEVTSGELDMAGAAFIGLLLMGLYQVFRGRIGPLPWYSAFWYAFGLFSKSLAEKTS